MLPVFNAPPADAPSAKVQTDEEENSISGNNCQKLCGNKEGRFNHAAFLAGDGGGSFGSGALASTASWFAAIVHGAAPSKFSATIEALSKVLRAKASHRRINEPAGCSGWPCFITS